MHEETVTLPASIRLDWAVNVSPKGKLLMVAFRLVHGIAIRRRANRFMWFLGLPFILAYRIVFEGILCVELPAGTEVGAALAVHHGHALVVNPRTCIGSYCVLRQSTTIGAKLLANGMEGPSPVLGDRVDVGANVVILGGITIGDDSTIGAGSVVVHDVPAGAVVVGNPARIVKIRTGLVPDKRGERP